MKPKRLLIVHPFLLAAYSVLGVFVQNSDTLPVSQVIRPLVIALLLSALIYFLLFRAYRDPDRAGYLATLVVLWLLFFGPLFHFAAFSDAIRSIPEYRLVLFLLWTLILGLLAAPFTWKGFRRKALLRRVLNITSFIVLVAPSIVIISLAISNRRLNRSLAVLRESEEITLDGEASAPDIYYIILDGHARQDVLNDLYNYDNSAFIDALRARGFYVADRSESNYMATQLSLPSSLNMMYLDPLTPLMGNSFNDEPLNELIQHSRIRQLLEQDGYKFVAVSSFALFNQITDADTFVSPVSRQVNEFEGLLLSISPLDLLLERFDPDIYLVNYNTQRKFINFALESMPQVASLPGPKFVFVHILAPHPPFVFDALGNPLDTDRPFFAGDANLFRGTTDEYIQGYRAQVEYIDNRMIQALDGILANASRPAVIIIQGDHGPGAYTDYLSVSRTCLNERYSILNAYYFPDQDYTALYPQITPVNSFRVVLDQFFDTGMGLLPDRNFYSSSYTPYQFVEVTGEVEKACQFR